MQSLIHNTIFLLIPLQLIFGFGIEHIPVQDEGRIKPLDTFARNHLLAFYGKRSIKESGTSAKDWMLNLILDPEKGRNEKIFNISNPEVVSSLMLDWTTDHKYSFNEIAPGLSNQSEFLNQIATLQQSELSTYEKHLLQLSRNLLRFEDITYLKALKMIPPAVNENELTWESPFDFILAGQLASLEQQKVLNSFQSYLAGRLRSDENMMSDALIDYQKAFISFPDQSINIGILKLETFYNKSNLFVYSLAFYLIGFILLCISWTLKNIWIPRFSYISLISGFILHGYGIVLRMYIMGRPPVTTLYESVVFVSFVLVLFSIILEYFRYDGLGIFVGTVSGSILHFIGFSYANDGDTLGMLVAVLDSNFWLATHVTTITLGYGASLMAGCIGHLYLIQSLRLDKFDKILSSIFKNLFGITLIALFFTLFGTILGGIWADQSWGRFWGWDPKENGALLIVLWQLMMIHMRLSGIAKPREFALGMGLNNIIVALAWFGVNLLQVGLHSYGFDDGVARNLFIFIGLELVICLGLYYYPRIQKKSITA